MKSIKSIRFKVRMHHFQPLRLLTILLIVMSASCGPDLNSPAKDSVAGKWQATDRISFFLNIDMQVTQTSAGDVTGDWQGYYLGGHLSCPSGIPSCWTYNTVSGRNEVVGISMEILGIGKFTGQLEGSNVLRGDIYRYDGDFPVKFTRVP